MPGPGRPVLVATFAVLTLIWGTTWAAIRIGLSGIPPLTGVSLRFTIAALVLLTIGFSCKIRFGRTRREIGLWLINGVLSFSATYGIVYWCEQWLPSGLASVLFSTMPLFVAVLAHFAIPGERLTARALVGIVLGFGGIAVIYSEDFNELGGPNVALAAVVMLGAPVVSAVAAVAVKRWGGGVHPISLSAVPMAITAGVTGALALALERGRPVVFDAVSLGALFYLAIMGTAVTFTLYFWLLSHIRATRISLIAYTSPVVAVLVGAVILSEPITSRTLAGSGLVLLGVAIAVHGRQGHVKTGQ